MRTVRDDVPISRRILAALDWRGYNPDRSHLINLPVYIVPFAKSDV